MERSKDENPKVILTSVIYDLKLKLSAFSNYNFEYYIRILKVHPNCDYAVRSIQFWNMQTPAKRSAKENHCKCATFTISSCHCKKICEGFYGIC